MDVHPTKNVSIGIDPYPHLHGHHPVMNVFGGLYFMMAMTTGKYMISGGDRVVISWENMTTNGPKYGNNPHKLGYGAPITIS